MFLVNTVCCLIFAIRLPPNSQDFGYSLDVLHHVPDIAAVS